MFCEPTCECTKIAYRPNAVCTSTPGPTNTPSLSTWGFLSLYTQFETLMFQCMLLLKESSIFISIQIKILGCKNSTCHAFLRKASPPHPTFHRNRFVKLIYRTVTKKVTNWVPKKGILLQMRKNIYSCQSSSTDRNKRSSGAVQKP